METNGEQSYEWLNDLTLADLANLFKLLPISEPQLLCIILDRRLEQAEKAKADADKELGKEIGKQSAAIENEMKESQSRLLKDSVN